MLGCEHKVVCEFLGLVVRCVNHYAHEARQSSLQAPGLKASTIYSASVTTAVLVTLFSTAVARINTFANVK